MVEEFIKLRHTLHQNPEVSGNEKETAKIIRDFALLYKPDEIIENLGGYGIAVVYKFSETGPTLLFRCELDALPIHEVNDISYCSKVSGVSHKCGHDGHMAILCSLFPQLQKRELMKGKVVVLFQPAEETGEGAARVINDPRFQNLNVDLVFALHNIPGEKKHEVILCNQGFSAEVVSIKINLTGQEAHAAEPEKGNNPALATAEIIQLFSTLNHTDPYSDSFAVLTPIYVNLGKEAYGISAGKSLLGYTIRTWDSQKMDELKKNIEENVHKISSYHALKFDLEWFEYFPASINDKETIKTIKEIAAGNALDLNLRPFPFKFGEDFGWFSKKYKTAMFGLGAGKNTLPLHHNAYDFPDDIIKTGRDIFMSIIDYYLK